MARVIAGAGCHWAIGEGFVARLSAGSVTGDGELTVEAAEVLASAERRQSASQDAAETYHLTVLVTTLCNLACAYCFQNTGLSTAGPRAVPVRIPDAVVDDDLIAATVSFTRRMMAERGATRLNLLLFGGEPTMYLDRCLGLLGACRDLGLAKASMISNGTLLTVAAAAALERAGLETVQVSFDGDVAHHDRSRVTAGGRGTFERILANLADASAGTDLRWQLRIQLTGESIDGADRLVDRLADRLDTAKFSVEVALVYDTGIGYCGTLDESTALAERVGAVYMHAADRGFGLPMPKAGSCATCGEPGGGSGAVVNSDGTLYSCWESAGRAGMEVGDVAGGYLPPEVIAPRWVTCGYSAGKPVDQKADAHRRYEDTLDAVMLDRLYAEGLLSAASAGWTAWTR